MYQISDIIGMPNHTFIGNSYNSSLREGTYLEGSALFRMPKLEDAYVVNKVRFDNSGEWILKYHVPYYIIHFKRNEKCKCNVWQVMWSINSHDAFFILYRRRTNVFGYIIVCGNKGEFIQTQYHLSFFHSYYVLIFGFLYQ